MTQRRCGARQKRRSDATERKQRKDANVTRDAAEFEDRGVVEGFAELIRVQEQKMRAEREIE